MLLAGAGATLLSADRAAAQAPTAPAPKAPPANAPSAAPPTKGPSKAAPANAPASAPSAAKAPPAKSPPPEPPSEDADAAPLQGVRTPEPTFRFPLLQEGSVLARAAATLRRDAESGTWVATLRDDLETERDREVTVLPSEVLEEMITHIRGRTEVQWFELTAMVLTYRQHNFLLPLMATPLSAEPPRPPRSFLMPPGTVPERAAEILEALHAALKMSREERKRHWHALDEIVRAGTAKTWCRSFVDALEEE